MRLAGALAVCVLAAASAAAASSPADSLRRERDVLGAHAHRSVLDLYALDARLQAQRLRLASLEARARLLMREQAQLQQLLAATRNALAGWQQRLAVSLTALYEQGDVNSLGVLLGARSLDDALTRLDDLGRVAADDERYVESTAIAQSRLEKLRATLGARRSALRLALSDARRVAGALAATRTNRLAFVERLERERNLEDARLHALERTAARAAHASAAFQAASVTPAAGRTLVVVATGYAIAGRTAIGMPVGWGVVAVDPAVIPLGTRLAIPGYGPAVAADTGGAVRGGTIDLWFPTLAQARAWGRRTVTVTLH